MKTISPLIQQIHSHDNPQYSSNQYFQQSSQYHKNAKIIKPKKAKCIVCRKMCNYNCPKCSKNYCGIEHYRSHNLFCSQAFYERQVTQSLKGLKVRDMNERKKAIQIMKNYQQQMQNLNFTYDITEERLQEILKQIQIGVQPKLTAKQQYLFSQYTDSLKNVEVIHQDKNSNKEQQGAQVEKPYWQIQDGMGIYLMQQVEIQEFGDSQYPQTIAERHLFKKRLQQFSEIHPQTETVIKPAINLHLVQIVYAYVTLFRSFDGENQQFAYIFAEAYCQKQNQNLLKEQNIKINSLINEMNLQIVRADEKMNGLSESENILQMWIKEYSQIVWEDIKKILGNKNLVLETLLRIIDLMYCVYKEIPQSENNKQILDIVNKVNEEKDQKLSREEKHRKMLKTKVIRKCQYLLYVVMCNYKQKMCTHICEQFRCNKNENMDKNSQIIYPKSQ